MSKRSFSAKPIVHQLVFELRYDYGHGYLDRAGEAIVELLRREPGWAFRKVDQGFTTFSNAELNATFNFGLAKLDLIQSQSKEVVKLMPVPDFALLANDLTATVLPYIGPVVPTRIGFRSRLLWESKSHEAAVNHLRGLESFRLATPDEDDLGAVTDCSFSFVYEALECKRRVALRTIEQQVVLDRASFEAEFKKIHGLPSEQRKDSLRQKMKEKKYVDFIPPHAIMLDVDSYLEEDDIVWDEMELADFIKNSFDATEKLIPWLLKKKTDI